jgi:hypothetical protein
MHTWNVAIGVLVGAAGCAASPAVLAGRPVLREVRCPDRRPPERRETICEPAVLEPDAMCARSRLVTCGQRLIGPPGSHGLICRDARGAITGPVQLVAPDRSVIAEGTCEGNRPTGTWYFWSDRRLVGQIGFDGERR